MPVALPINKPARPVYVHLYGPYGVINVSHCRIEVAVNKGISWSIKMPEFFDAYFGDDATQWVMMIGDGISSFISPTLTATHAVMETDGSGDSFSVDGIDLTSWVLTESDIVKGTYKQTTSVDLLQAIALGLGLTISGAELYTIVHEDVNNQKFHEVLSRVLDKAGQVYYIDESGAILIVSNMYRRVAVSPFNFTKASWGVNYIGKVDSLKIGKTSRTAGGSATGDENCFRFDSIGFKSGQFKTPTFNAAPYDRSLYGYVYYVTTFNGDPKGGIVVNEFKLLNDSTIFTSPVQNPLLPATHFTCVVNEPVQTIGSGRKIDAKVCFTGRPQSLTPTAPVQPLDVTFLVQIGRVRPTTIVTPTTRTRPYDQVKIDTLYPSAAWTILHAPQLLFEHNRASRRLEMSGPLDLTVGLFNTYQAYRYPSFVCDTFIHEISMPNSATTAIGGVDSGLYDWCVTNGVQIPIQT